MNWWLQFLPLQAQAIASQQPESHTIEVQKTSDPDAVDLVMRLRQPKSRIYFLRRFFDYPVSEAQVLDSTVPRMDKTYRAYFGSYERFPEGRKDVDGFEDLFLVGAAACTSTTTRIIPC
jgi:hypothetical protein